MVTWSFFSGVCCKRNSNLSTTKKTFYDTQRPPTPPPLQKKKINNQPSQSIGSLSNDDGNGNENVTRKYIFISFVLLRDYFNSLNFYKNGELSRNQIGGSGVQVKNGNEKFTVVRSRSPENLKFGHFTLLFCRGRQRKLMYQNVKRICRAIVFAH